MLTPPISLVAPHKLYDPLSDREFEKALGDMKVGKAPGPDGLPLQYYKTFTGVLKK